MLAPLLPRAELVSVADHESIRAEWTELSQRAIEPNPFYEPDHLIAMCEHVRPHEEHSLVMVRERGSNRLNGLFPVTVKGWRDGFPGGATYMSFDSLIGQTVPLVAGEEPHTVWAAFLDFVAKSPELPNIVHLHEFYADSPAGLALARAEKQMLAVRKTESRFQRAVAVNLCSHERYVERWPNRKAQNIRRRLKKLAAAGAVELDIVETSDPAFEPVLAEILELERASWKGRAGTALASQEATRRFTRAAYAAGGKSPEIHLATLRLDGKLIAGDINLIAQKRAYFIKSAYDEAYSKYGPGMILFTYALEEMLKEGRYERLDSCADGGHPLEEIWLERERVERCFVAAGEPENERAIRGMMARRSALFRLRGAARRASELVRSGS